MSVSEFKQPSFTSQDAATYKAAIDSSIAALAEPVNCFAPHELPVPSMGIMVESGITINGTVIPPTNIGGIGAATTHPRIDRIYFNQNLNSFERLVGTEAASPVPPVLPFGVIPVCKILVGVGVTKLTNEDITDERVFLAASAAIIGTDGYTSIIDPSGLFRVLIGKLGVDNRIIFKLFNDLDSSLIVQNASGETVAAIDAQGNMKIKGTLTESFVF